MESCLMIARCEVNNAKHLGLQGSNPVHDLLNAGDGPSFKTSSGCTKSRVKRHFWGVPSGVGLGTKCTWLHSVAWDSQALKYIHLLPDLLLLLFRMSSGSAISLGLLISSWILHPQVSFSLWWQRHHATLYTSTTWSTFVFFTIALHCTYISVRSVHWVQYFKANH